VVRSSDVDAPTVGNKHAGVIIEGGGSGGGGGGTEPC
jgi:hypothetical protein